MPVGMKSKCSLPLARKGGKQMDRLATESEAAREYGRNAGMEDPSVEWILTPWDSWERNPFYTGKPGRHPEDDYED
jgi:hypothetical protein